VRREQFTPRVRRASSVPEPGEIIVPILILRSRVLHPGNERPRVKTLSLHFTSFRCHVIHVHSCTHARLHSFVRWGAIRGEIRTRRAMRACVRRERTCSTPCARPVSDPARRRRRTVVGRPPVVVRVHWTWMNWDARRGPWCVRARGRRDDWTDGIPLLYSFPRSYTRWRRITRYARLAPASTRRRRASGAALFD
jgi:hypothetical protein